jgi:hypothetical protein
MLIASETWTDNTTGMMGRANDSMAVVDSKANVIGVSGLRVIDSSSFRFTPPGHTQAATCESYAIPELIFRHADGCSLDAHAEKLVEDVERSFGRIRKDSQW